MAKKERDGDAGASAGAAVVERDVDVDAVERELESEKNGKDKKDPKMAVIAGGDTKFVSRHEFIRAAQKYKPKVAIVDLPAPFEGRQIKVRELTAGERDKYEGRMIRGRLGNQKMDLTQLRVGLIIMAAVDWDNEAEPLFVEKDADDLRNFGISVIQAIYEVAAKLSAVSKEDEDELLGN